MSSAVQIFCCYTYEDQKFFDKIEKHLKPLMRSQKFTLWDERYIPSGNRRMDEIQKQLSSSTIVLLFISPDFLASDDHYNIMRQALERHENGTTHVIPIILRTCGWKETAIGKLDLQPLPEDGKPVAKWGDDNDDVFQSISDGIQKAVEYRTNQENIDHDIPVPPIELPSPFNTLDHCLKHRKFSYFNEDLLYYPEKYIADIKDLLENKRRVLLIGDEGAGKTGLAIALAKRLQKNERYQAFYLDIAVEQATDERKWLHAIRTCDRLGSLYILDNCHLAPETVSEFCIHLEEEPFKQAQCILISRPCAQASDERDELSEESDDYFKRWAEVGIEVQPKDLYRGIIDKYKEAYLHQEPARSYISLEEDDEAALRKQHAHNLVMSRIRLEAWCGLGGRLSELTRDVVYKSLGLKYLGLKKVDGVRKALLSFCALRQFEIPMHCNFVDSASLPKDEVKNLEKNKQLIRSSVQGYGIFYQLTHHSTEAREIFRAGIYYKEGGVDAELIERETFRELRAYLMQQPSNYSHVYYQLYRDAQRNNKYSLLHSLLKDPGLQDCALQQFQSPRIFDAIAYLHNLSQVDHLRALQLLNELVKHTKIAKIRLKILENSLLHIGVSLSYIQQINTQVAEEIVAEMDIQQLALSVQQQDMYQLYWLMRGLKKVSLAQARTLLEQIPTPTLATMIMHDHLGFYKRILSTLDLSHKWESIAAQETIEAIDMQQLASHAKTLNPQKLYQFMQGVERTFPAHTEMILERIFVEQTGTHKQLATLTNLATDWLATNAQNHNDQIPLTYFKLIERLGNPEQISAFIDATTNWLVAHPEFTYVYQTYQTYLGLVGRHGTPQQLDALIDIIARWLDKQIISISEACKEIKKLQEIPEQPADLIDAIATWLANNPLDIHIRRLYLALLEIDNVGTLEQLRDAIATTTSWLATNPQDIKVRQVYLGFIRRKGNQQEATALIDATTEWLANHAENKYVHRSYLRLVEDKGTLTQRKMIIDATNAWLTTNPGSAKVRDAYFQLVIHWGTPVQCDMAVKWWDANPGNAKFQGTYHRLKARSRG